MNRNEVWRTTEIESDEQLSPALHGGNFNRGRRNSYSFSFLFMAQYFLIRAETCWRSSVLIHLRPRRLLNVESGSVREVCNNSSRLAMALPIPSFSRFSN